MHVVRLSLHRIGWLILLYAMPVVALSAYSPFFLEEWIYLSILAGACIWLTLTDLDDFIIPDAASIIVLLTGLLLSWGGGVWPLVIDLVVGLILFSSLAVIGELYFRKHGREALGLGDAKLLGASVPAVGAEHVWLMILGASLTGILVALVGRGFGVWRVDIPFGPFLAFWLFAVTVYGIALGPGF